VSYEDEFMDLMKQQNIKCGLGWYGLIMSVLSQTRWFNKNHPGYEIQIDSFEEKRGALNIVVSKEYWYYLKYYFDKAREASTQTCEYCGCPGKLRKCNDGRYKTLCRECRRKYRKRRRFKKPDDALFDYMKQQIIQCGFGWYGLIFPLVVKLKEWNENRPEEYRYNRATFRPNWYMLRINMTGGSTDLGRLVEKAESASLGICEDCGCPGETVEIFGWLKIRCPDCAKDEEEAGYQRRLKMFAPLMKEEANQEEKKIETN
jgi:hypothetical protein